MHREVVNSVRFWIQSILSYDVREGILHSRL